jgi:hypothetical protein
MPYTPKYNIQNLTPWTSKWQSGETKAYRLPIALADSILAYARALDSGKLPPADNQLSDALATILSKVDANQKGYQNRNAGQLIRDLRGLNSE